MRQRGDELVLARVLLLEHGGVANPLDVRPAPVHHFRDDHHLVGGPAARARLVQCHHRDQAPFLDQAGADDGLDADGVEHACTALLAELRIDVVHHEVAPLPQVGGGLRAEQVERVDPGAAGHAVDGPVAADREAVAVAVDVGIGAARGAERLPEDARGGGHDGIAVLEVARRLADLVEDAQALFAHAARGLGPDALGHVDDEADPLRDLAGLDHGRALCDHAAVLAVAAAKAVLQRDRLRRGGGLVPQRAHRRAVLGMDRVEPAPPGIVVMGLAREGLPQRVQCGDGSVSRGVPDQGVRDFGHLQRHVPDPPNRTCRSYAARS